MRSIYDIYESILDNDQKVAQDLDDRNQDQLDIDVITATYLSILRKGSWKDIANSSVTSWRHKKPSGIDYKDVVRILNKYFGYKFDEKEARYSYGKIWKLASEKHNRSNFTKIENLLNDHMTWYWGVGIKEVELNPRLIREKYIKVLQERGV